MVVNNNNSKDIKADMQTVVDMTTWILRNGVDSYLKEHPGTSFIDAFMAMHSAHKIVISNIAANWALQGVPEEKTYRMADMSFRQAMRELRSNLPVKN